MRKHALLAIASIVILSIVRPTVSTSMDYIPARYYYVGQHTYTATYGVYAGIQVCDPDVNHGITTDPYTFFCAWVGVWDSTRTKGLTVGWMETEKWWPTTQNLGALPPVPGDEQYLYVEKPNGACWIYPEYELDPGALIYVHIRHLGSGVYACYISWNAVFVELPNSRTDMSHLFPYDYAEVTSAYGEVHIGDASGQIPGCPVGYGYALQVVNDRTNHQGTRFSPIWIKLDDDPPEYNPPWTSGWAVWSVDIPTVTLRTDGIYYGEWLLPNPHFPWIKYDTRYHSFIFYTDDPQDVSVTSVSYELPWDATAIYPSWVIDVNASVENEGANDETFNVTTYYFNDTFDAAIGTQTVTLSPHTGTTLTYSWNTTEVSPGNAGLDYTISAHAWPLPGENDTADNTYIDGTIRVKYPGDVDGDGDVDNSDKTLFMDAFKSQYGDPDYDWRCDFDGDGDVDNDDFSILKANRGHTP